MKWLGYTIAVGCGAVICAVGITVASRQARLADIKPPTSPTKTDFASRPSPPSQGFVGSQACAECHQVIAARYQTHPMSHSMSSLDQPTQEETVGMGTFGVGSSLEYRVERKDAVVMHREIRRDAGEQIIYDQPMRVNYAVGSGTHGKGFLIQHDDLFFLSPISWYTTRGKWDLSPGYTEAHNPRFERRATDGCLNCHAGRVAFDRKERDRFPTPHFLELSIGCERCHGPGEQHVAWHRQADKTGLADVIVNPGKLDARRREAVCYDCHLQAEARLLRYGRTFFDFRPGMELEEIATAFAAGNKLSGKDESSRFVGQVTQIRESRCHTGSNGRLGCVSCHDPHGVPAPAEKVEFYRHRCETCHQERGCTEPLPSREQTQQNSCIACHMPQISSVDVPHASHTDHRIRRRPGDMNELANKQSQPPVPVDNLIPFDEWDLRLFKSDTDRAWGLMYAFDSEKHAASRQASAAKAEPRLKQALKERPDDQEVAESLASVLLTLKRRAEAREVLQQVIEQDPQNEFALLQLALICHQEQEWKRAEQYWTRYLDRNPWIALTQIQFGQTLVKAGKIEGAIKAAETALERNPGLLPAHLWLADNLPRVGQAEAGRRHKEQAERLRSGAK